MNVMVAMSGGVDSSVAAALLMPHEGRIAKTMMRMPSVFAATAALPKVETMRIIPIQLAICTRY